MGLELGRDRSRLDHRVAPLVPRDPLRQDLRAQTVGDAADRVDADGGHGRAGPATGICITDSAAQPPHGPCRAWSSNCDANVFNAVATKCAIPLGWWQAPRPGSSEAQRSRSANALLGALPSAIPCSVRAIADGP